MPWEYLNADGRIIGPISIVEMKRLSDAGTLTKQTQVRKIGSDEWGEAESVCKALFRPRMTPNTTTAENILKKRKAKKWKMIWLLGNLTVLFAIVQFCLALGMFGDQQDSIYVPGHSMTIGAVLLFVGLIVCTAARQGALRNHPYEPKSRIHPRGVRRW